MSSFTNWRKQKADKKLHKDSHMCSGGKAQQMGKELSLQELLKQDSTDVEREMEKEQLLWFHGNINRRLAETKLKKGGNTCGLFLIRESNVAVGDFVLTFVHNTPHTYGHYMITQKADSRFSLEGEQAIEGVDKLLKHYIHNKHSLPFIVSRPLRGQNPPALCLHAGFTNILHRTIEKGDTNLAMSILDHELCPDINSKDNSGSSTLHMAVQHGLMEIVEKLVQKSVCLSCCDRDGFTPLHRACQRNASGMAEVLVGAGADAQYRHRDTENVALHEAAALGHKECVQVLLAHGAAAWTRNVSSKTPYELAIKFGHPACGQIIDEFEPPPALSNMKDWFHEKLTRQDAAGLLAKHEFRDGLFVVRKNSRNRANFVLSVAYNGTCRHYEIVHEGNIAFHIDNGPLLSTLEHLVDYYARHSDGMECCLLTAIMPGGALKAIIMSDEDENGYENSQVIYGVHENGGNVYMEAKSLWRRGSLPQEAPPPPPPKPTPSLFEGKGKHPLILLPDSIELGFELGQGEYGSVLRGVWTGSCGKQVDVAIKTMNEEGMENSKKLFLQEAEVMVRLTHPCIVALIGVSEGPPLMLVQELVSLGSLMDFLLDYPEKIDAEVDLVLWAAQVACGMLYLESQGYVHRDLATRNILLAGKQQAKVGDFGLSRAVEGTSDVYRAAKGGRWPVKWYAPEAINYGQFSHASDVWSFGVTLWEMYTSGEQPYGDMKGAQVIAFLEKGSRLEQPPKCPQIIYDIMRDCWQYDVANRPTFKWLLDYFNSKIKIGSLRLASQGVLDAYSNV